MPQWKDKSSEIHYKAKVSTKLTADEKHQVVELQNREKCDYKAMYHNHCTCYGTRKFNPHSTEKAETGH